MKGASQLIAALSLHGLHLCVVERMEGQVLHFTVVLKVYTHTHTHRRESATSSECFKDNGEACYLFEEEVVGQVVEHHGVAGVDGVGPRQQLHAVLDGVGLLVVELQHRQPHQGSHAFRIELEGSTESQTSLFQFVELHKTVAHPQADLSCSETEEEDTTLSHYYFNTVHDVDEQYLACV